MEIGGAQVAAAGRGSPVGVKMAKWVVFTIGLLMAASADLVFDRMLKRDMAVYHGVGSGQWC